MRVLVLDGSRVLPALVRRVAPPDLEVETADSFEKAAISLCQNPPEAVIVNLSPSPLPWSDLLICCRRCKPPIPILFESCVYRSAEEAGVGELSENGFFLAKPYGVEELRAELQRLLVKARGVKRSRARAEVVENRGG